MGYVYADIELINTSDITLARRNYIKPEEVKRMTIMMPVDSGAYNLCINEVIQQQLDLPFIEKRRTEITKGNTSEVNVVGPVDVRFQNRSTVCYALVLPGNSQVLLGFIPLGDMDVLIDEQRQELIIHPDHPYYAQIESKIKTAALHQGGCFITTPFSRTTFGGTSHYRHYENLYCCPTQPVHRIRSGTRPLENCCH